MKKIISIILSLVLMIASMSALTVATASSNPMFSFESKEVKAGETFELKLNLDNNPGIAGIAISIKYNEDVFTLSDTIDGGMFSGFTAGKNFIFDESDNVTEDGTLATFIFTVANDAPSADYNFDIIIRSCVNIDLEDVESDVSSGTVKVNAKPVSVLGVSLDKNTLSIKTGESEQLTANILPDNATNKAVTWESGDSDIATVDESGNVTGIKAGTATITVTTDDGSFTDTCVVTVDCSHSSTTVIPSVSSTCIEYGHGEYTVCNDCGAVVSGSDAEFPLAPHKYIENAQEEYLVSVATCVDKAVYYKSCSVCGTTGTETFEYGEVDSSNHIGDTYVRDYREPTCYYEGYSGNIYCSSCKKIISAGTPIPMTEHSYGEWAEITVPTCTEPGEEARICSVCGKEEKREIPATGHTLSEDWEQTIAPTCTESGEEVNRCEVCGEVLDTRTVPATGHTAGEWTVIKDATCTTDGERKTICTVCGEEYTEVISAKGHQFGELVVVKEATETEEGIREHVCNVCGEKETQIIPMLTTENNNEDNTVKLKDSNASDNTQDNSKTSPNTGSESIYIIFIAIGSAVIAIALLAPIKKKELK